MVVNSAGRLEQAGAESLVICANTMHKYYDRVAAGIPVIHVADCLGARMAREGVTNAALGCAAGM